MALFFVAAVVGGTAYVTRRTVRRDRFDLAHHQAVNRLVLGKACALVGALVVGGYLGYALAQLGVDEPAADVRLWRSLLAALAASRSASLPSCSSSRVASRRWTTSDLRCAYGSVPHPHASQAAQRPRHRRGRLAPVASAAVLVSLPARVGPVARRRRGARPRAVVGGRCG